jgi:hypothetical protein
MDEKVEYVRSAYLNARMPHVINKVLLLHEYCLYKD